MNMRNEANNAKADVESMLLATALYLSFSSFCKGWGFGIVIDASFPKLSSHFFYFQVKVDV